MCVLGGHSLVGEGGEVLSVVACLVGVLKGFKPTARCVSLRDDGPVRRLSEQWVDGLLVLVGWLVVL